MLRSFKLKESIMINLSLIYTEFSALLLEESNCFFVSLLLIFALKMDAFLLNIKYTLKETML